MKYQIINYIFIVILFLFPSTSTQAKIISINGDAGYSLFRYDFNGDERTDMAECTNRQLRLYFTEANKFSPPSTPQVIINIPNEIAVIGPAKIAWGTRYAQWFAFSQQGIWKANLDNIDCFFHTIHQPL